MKHKIIQITIILLSLSLGLQNINILNLKNLSRESFAYESDNFIIIKNPETFSQIRVNEEMGNPLFNQGVDLHSTNINCSANYNVKNSNYLGNPQGTFNINLNQPATCFNLDINKQTNLAINLSVKQNINSATTKVVVLNNSKFLNKILLSPFEQKNTDAILASNLDVSLPNIILIFSLFLLVFLAKKVFSLNKEINIYKINFLRC